MNIVSTNFGKYAISDCLFIICVYRMFFSAIDFEQLFSDLTTLFKMDIEISWDHVAL